jgi:predicted methyltransferase
MRLRIRVAVFILAALLCLFAANSLARAVNTIRYLDAIEAQRDQWQRPSDVIAALGLSQGQVAADIGCGAGYFALKLSHEVGPGGQVLAVDTRKLPLAFLGARGLLRGQHNIRVRLGASDDPRLPAGAVDRILVSNTYHEFTNAGDMLERMRKSLRPGGRLVVLDRSAAGADAAGEGADHIVSPERVRRELGEHGFKLSEYDDRFVVRPGGESWWLIVALPTFPGG